MTWIKSWLTQHTQSVVVDGTSSPSVYVLSGVPQGTVLGPLMIILMILLMKCHLPSAYSLMTAFYKIQE